MDFLRHIADDSRRFLDAARQAPAATAVPSCPGWDAAELVWHLSEVQLFWADIVARGLDDPENVIKPERPAEYEELLALAGDAATRLIDALSNADPAAPVWTWARDQTVGFVLRRQAHEALIHRVDAELTAGVDIEVDAALATDGIDEMVQFFIGGDLPDWATFTPDGTEVRLAATDADRTWGLALGRFTGTSPVTGNTYDLDASMDADVGAGNTISGTAAALDLWLWGRGDASVLEVTGDPDLVTRLRAIAADGTQ